MDSTVDVAGDMAEINAGNFTRAGEDIVVNGRTYGWHPDKGTTFPKSGAGFHELSVPQHKYLKMLNQRGIQGANQFGANLDGLSEADMKYVRDLWKTCK